MVELLLPPQLYDELMRMGQDNNVDGHQMLEAMVRAKLVASRMDREERMWKDRSG